MTLHCHITLAGSMNIKALVFGSIITTIILLSGQLAYVLLASYMSLAALDVLFLKEHIQLLWYVMSMLTYGICFAAGGFFTALISEDKKLKTASLVGFLVALISVLTTDDLNDLNYKAVIFMLVGLGCAALGGRWGSDDVEENAEIRE